MLGCRRAFRRRIVAVSGPATTRLIPGRRRSAAPGDPNSFANCTCPFGVTATARARPVIASDSEAIHLAAAPGSGVDRFASLAMMVWTAPP